MNAAAKQGTRGPQLAVSAQLSGQRKSLWLWGIYCGVGFGGFDQNERGLACSWSSYLLRCVCDSKVVDKRV